MKIIITILAILSGCGFVDKLDGHIDNQQNCCAAVSAKSIQECMVKFEGPGWCWEVECTAPIGHVEAYLHEDGEITTCPAGTKAEDE